jgi:DNA-binding transcriptional regulator LsrR (DeoR family)
MSQRQQQIEWRRSKVLELSSQGYTQIEIGQKLQVDRVTVHRDLAFLRQQAQENLQHHIHEVVPEEYQKCMVGMKCNLKQTLEIAETAIDPKVKLQARAIANDCYKFIMEMSTNAGIVSDALKFVNQSKEKINTMQKQTIEEIEETEATTTSNVY